MMMRGKQYFYSFLLGSLIFMPFSRLTEAANSYEAKTTGTASEILNIDSFCVGAPWSKVVWIHPHANEITSRQIAIQFIAQQQQGCLYSFQHTGSRNIQIRNNHINYYFDPNRIFTAHGRQHTLKCIHGNCTEAIKQLNLAVENFIHTYLKQPDLIVAFHNNRQGGLSINSYQGKGYLARNVYKTVRFPQANAHDFFYVTSATAFQFFAQRGFNVAQQNNQQVQDDGSLSVWAALNRKDYINIEAGMDHVAAQTKMLQAVTEYMQYYYQ